MHRMIVSDGAVPSDCHSALHNCPPFHKPRWTDLLLPTKPAERRILVSLSVSLKNSSVVILLIFFSEWENCGEISAVEDDEYSVYSRRELGCSTLSSVVFHVTQTLKSLMATDSFLY